MEMRLEPPRFNDGPAVRAMLARAQSLPPEFEILGIGMQNFQSIREPQFAPFAPLTLLYGPNSAGKSAIADALRFLSTIDQSSFKGPSQLLTQWKCRQKELPSAFVDTEHSVALWCFLGTSPNGAGASVPGIKLNDAARLRKAVRSGPVALRVSLTYGPQGWYEYTGLAVWLGSNYAEPAIELTTVHEEETATFPDGVPYPEWVRKCNLRVNFSSAPISLLESLAAEISAEAVISFGAYLRTARDAGETLDISIEWSGIHSHEFAPLDDRSGDKSICALVSAILRLLVADVAAASQLRVVPPVRHVPNDRESSFVVLASDHQGSGPTTPSFKEDVEGTAVDPWEELAESACGQWSTDIPAHLAWANFLRDESIYDPSGAELFKYVNDVFQKESMLGLDYEVVANRYQLHSEAQTRRAGKRVHKVSERRKGEVVRLLLRDELGADVALADVGTGISQLIPILVALMAKRSIIVHQPELHLHPRLQSAFGDVFIERLGYRARLLTMIESHSEHLLLRFLRRIREADGDAPHGCARGIVPAQMVVLYFERESGAPTRIHNLRVSSSGDFLDRWPRGFFNERDEDLGITGV